MHPKPISRLAFVLAATLALIAPAAAPALAEVLPPAAVLELARARCAAAPDSEDCRLAEGQLAEQVAGALYTLARGGQRQQAVALVRGYADWPFPKVREAAAIALGGLRPNAEDTPVLARLLNDPAPGVRRAAQAALNASDDPLARRLAERAGWSDDGSLEPEPSPLERLGLAFTLPEGSEPLRFTRDAEAGIQSFVTERQPAELLAFFSAVGGQPVLNLDGLSALIARTWPGIDINDPMQVSRFYEELQERIESLPPEEQQQALIEAMQELEEMQEGPAAATARWRDGSLWGSPRAVVLTVDPETAAPTLLALVYLDRTLGRTGFALQWLPRSTMPGWSEEGEPLPATTPATPTPTTKAAPPAMSFAEAEALLWDEVKDSTLPEELESFLAVFPYGAHRDEAEARLAALRAPPVQEVPQAEAPAAEAPATGGEAPAAETATAPTLALGNPGVAAHQAIVVRFAGLPTGSGDWIAVSQPGSPDNSYEAYAMTGGKAAGEVTLTGQFAGDHELRAYSETPSRSIVARLTVTIAPAAPVTLTAAKASFAPGEPIVVRFAGMPANSSDWIGLSPPDMADGGYIDWSYSYGKVEGEVTLQGEPAGEYEIRAYADSPKRTVLARLRILVQ